MKRHLIQLGILIATVLPLYLPTVDYPFVFDDLASITANRNVRIDSLDPASLYDAATTGIVRRRPLAYLSFALNYYFGDYNPSGYRLANILIHVLAGVLVYAFVHLTRVQQAQDHVDTATTGHGRTRARKTPSRQTSAWPAFVVALLWLVHPIQIQSVTYIVQRMTSMTVLFYMAALCLYIVGRRSRRRQVGIPFFIGALGAWIIALGCKEIAVTAPVIVFIYEWYFFQDLNRQWLVKACKYVVLPVAATAAIGLLMLRIQPIDFILSGYEKRDFTMIERVLTQFRVVVHYLAILVYPHPERLTLEYDFPVSTSLVSPVTTLASLLFLLLLLGLGIAMARRQRLVSFCILWFFINLALESSVFALEMAYEHRLYLPSVGFVLALVLVYLRYVPKHAVIRYGPLIAAIVLLVWATIVRNAVWSDELTLWDDAIKKAPNKPRLHVNLGKMLRQRGDLAQAEYHYCRALELEPDSELALINLAVCLFHMDKPEEALVLYEKVIGMNPEIAAAHYNMGITLNGLGRKDEAAAAYREALRIDPDNAEAHSNYGNMLYRLHKYDEAISHFREALRVNPDFSVPHNSLGGALLNTGDVEGAVYHFREALRIDPGYANARENLHIARQRQRPSRTGD